MRCPKCGYISFDHLETCLKCSKDVSKAASQVGGTTYNVAAPSFLRFQPNEDIEIGGDSEIRFENGKEDFDVVDPDLNILVDGEDDSAEDTGVSFDDEFGGLDALGEDDEIEVVADGEDEDDDGGLDLGQFEDAFGEEDSASGDDEPQFDMPDELSDISDLDAPPDSGDEVPAFSFDEPEESPVVGKATTEDGLDDFNLDLDNLGSDFSLSSPEEKELQNDDDMGLGSLSLDDIGIVDSKEKPVKKEIDSLDMDGDLDFDLDLGGLSLTDD
jgi:hypothetical protein